MIGWLVVAWAGELPHDRPGEPNPDRHWDVVHLDLRVRIDPAARAVQGQTHHHLEPLGAPSRTVRFHQRSLDIQAVRVDGQPVTDFRLGRDTLDIPVAPGVPHDVTVDFAATPQTGLHFRDPRGTSDPVIEVWSQGEDVDNRHWFPSWDHPSDRFTVRTEVTVPDGLVALANGPSLGSAPASPGWTTWTYQLDRPIVNYLVAVTVGDHRVVRDAGPVPLEYVGAATLDEATLRRGLDAAGPQMAYLSALLDEPFPYPLYRQVAVSRFLYGGMENATLTVLDDTMIQPQDGPTSRRVDEVVAHELAHQWFGDLLTCYGWRELWLNEGMATFYAGRWGEHAHGAAFYADEVDGWMREASDLDAPMAPRGWSAVPGRDSAGVYSKGAATLHMLRVMLGDAVFDAGIRSYVDQNADRLVETDDLRRALEDASGTHLGWFFDQWVHGTGTPSLSSSWAWSEGELVVTVDQTTEGPAFWAPVEVEVGHGDAVTVHRGWIGDGAMRVVVACDTPPDWVAVDPRAGVLAHWDRAQEPAQWIAQATRSPSPAARLAALRALGEAPDDGEASAALAGVLADAAAAPDLRRQAARSLGALGTDAAAAALARHVEDPEAGVRRAVVSALGEVEAQTTWVAALERRLDRDPRPEVRSAALSAIAALDADRGLALARRALGQPDRSWHGQLHGAALGVIGEHGVAADLDAVLARTDARLSYDVRSNAGWAAARLLSREGADDATWREKARTRASAALIPWLDDLDQRAREAAIWLLASVGDDRAEDALQRFATENEVAGLSEQARDAANTIRSRPRAGQPDAEPTPDEDLERIDESLEDLRQRLERLETWRSAI